MRAFGLFRPLVTVALLSLGFHHPSLAGESKKTVATAVQKALLQDTLLRLKDAISKKDLPQASTLINMAPVAGDEPSRQKALRYLEGMTLITGFDPMRYILLTGRLRGDFGALFYSAPADPAMTRGWDLNEAERKLIPQARMLVAFRFHKTNSGWMLLTYKEKGPSVVEAQDPRQRDLSFLQSIRAFDPDPKARRARIGAKRALAGNSTAFKAPALPARPPIKKTVTISRYELDGSLRDLPKVLGQARIVPDFKDGTADGFKVFGFSPKSVYQRLHFENGDVLYALGGQPLNEPNSVVDLFQELKTKDSVYLWIRDAQGKRREVHYVIKQ